MVVTPIPPSPVPAGEQLPSRSPPPPPPEDDDMTPRDRSEAGAPPPQQPQPQPPQPVPGDAEAEETTEERLLRVTLALGVLEMALAASGGDSACAGGAPAAQTPWLWGAQSAEAVARAMAVIPQDSWAQARAAAAHPVFAPFIGVERTSAWVASRRYNKSASQQRRPTIKATGGREVG